MKSRTASESTWHKATATYESRWAATAVKAEKTRQTRRRAAGGLLRSQSLHPRHAAHDGTRADPKVGDEIELLHDIHERLNPIDAVQFAKDVERFKLFFLEDPLAPEDLEWFHHIRQQCSTPIAMGELFQ